MSVKGKRKRGNDQDSPAASSSAAGAQVVVPASITSASTAPKSGGVINGTFTVAGGRPSSEDGKIQVTFLRADVDQQWVGRISIDQSLADVSSKVAKKLCFPAGTDIRLAHMREAGREVDIWDRYDLDTLRQRAADHPDADLSIKAYAVAGPSTSRAFRTPLPSSHPSPSTAAARPLTPSPAAVTPATTPAASSDWRKGKQRRVESVPGSVDAAVANASSLADMTSSLSPKARRKMEKKRLRNLILSATLPNGEALSPTTPEIPTVVPHIPSLSSTPQATALHAAAGPSTTPSCAMTPAPKEKKKKRQSTTAEAAAVPSSENTPAASKAKRKRSITPLQLQSALDSDIPQSSLTPSPPKKKKKKKSDASINSTPETTSSSPTSADISSSKGPGAALRRQSYKPAKPSPLGLSFTPGASEGAAPSSVDQLLVGAEPTGDIAAPIPSAIEEAAESVPPASKPKKVRVPRSSSTSTTIDSTPPTAEAGPSTPILPTKSVPGSSRSTTPLESAQEKAKPTTTAAPNWLARFREEQARKAEAAAAGPSSGPAATPATPAAQEVSQPAAVSGPAKAAGAKEKAKKEKKKKGKNVTTAVSEASGESSNLAQNDQSTASTTEETEASPAIPAKGKKAAKEKKDKKGKLAQVAPAESQMDTDPITDTPEPASNNVSADITADPRSAPAFTESSSSTPKSGKAPKAKPTPKAKINKSTPASSTSGTTSPSCLVCGSKQVHTQAACPLVLAGVSALEERLEVVMREMSGGRYWAQGVEAIESWIKKLREEQAEKEAEAEPGPDNDEEEEEEEQEDEEETLRRESPPTPAARAPPPQSKAANDSSARDGSSSSGTTDAAPQTPGDPVMIPAPVSDTTEVPAPAAETPTADITPPVNGDSADIPPPAKTPSAKLPDARKTPITYSRPNTGRKERAASSASSGSSSSRSEPVQPAVNTTADSPGPATTTVNKVDSGVPIPIYLRGLGKAKRRSGSVGAVSASTALIETEDDSDSASDSGSDSGSDSDEEGDEESELGAETDAEAEFGDGEGDEDEDVSMDRDEETAFNAGTPVKSQVQAGGDDVEEEEEEKEEDEDEEEVGDDISETTTQAIARLDLPGFNTHSPTGAGLPANKPQRSDKGNDDSASEISSADSASTSTSILQTAQTPDQRRPPLPSKSPATVKYDGLPDPQSLFDQFFSRPLSQAEKAKVRETAAEMGDVSLRPEGDADEDEDEDVESVSVAPINGGPDDASSIGDFSVADREEEVETDEIAPTQDEEGQRTGFGEPPVVLATQADVDMEDSRSDRTSVPPAGQSGMRVDLEATGPSVGEEEEEEEADEEEEGEEEAVVKEKSANQDIPAGGSQGAGIDPTQTKSTTQLPATQRLLSPDSDAENHQPLPSQAASAHSISSTNSRRSARFGELDEQAGPSQNVGESAGAIAFAQARAEEATPEPESEAAPSTQVQAEIQRGRRASQVIVDVEDEEMEAATPIPKKRGRPPKAHVSSSQQSTKGAASSSQQSTDSASTRRRSGRIQSIDTVDHVEPAIIQLNAEDVNTPEPTPLSLSQPVKGKGKAKVVPKRRSSSQGALPASQASQSQPLPSMDVLVEESEEGLAAPPAPAPSSSQADQLDSSLPNGDHLPTLTQRRSSRRIISSPAPQAPIPSSAPTSPIIPQRRNTRRVGTISVEPPSPAQPPRSSRMTRATSAQSQSSQPSQIPETQPTPLFMPQSQYPETQAYTLHAQPVQYSSPRESQETPQARPGKGRKAAASPIPEESDEEAGDNVKTPTGQKGGEMLTNGDDAHDSASTNGDGGDEEEAQQEEEEREYVSEVDDDVSPRTASAVELSVSVDKGNDDEEEDEDDDTDSILPALLSIRNRRPLPASQPNPSSSNHHLPNVSSSFPSLGSLSRDVLRSFTQSLGFGGSQPKSPSQTPPGKVGGKLMVTPGGEVGSEEESDSESESGSGSGSDSESGGEGVKKGGTDRGLRGRYVSATRKKKVVKTKGKNVGW